MYDDEFVWSSSASAKGVDPHTCTVKIADDFELRVLIPQDYPSKSPPLYELDPRWLDRPEAAEMKALLDSSFNKVCHQLPLRFCRLFSFAAISIGLDGALLSFVPCYPGN